MQLLDQVVSWFVPAVCGAAATLVAVAWRYGRAVIHGLRVLLRAEIIRIHREYVQTNSPIPVEVMDEADDAYSAYNALGGNGTGTKMHDDIMAAHNGPLRKERGHDIGAFPLDGR